MKWFEISKIYLMFHNWRLVTRVVSFQHCISQWNICRSDFAPCEWPNVMFENGLRRLISSASISLASVLKRHFFDNVEFCSAGIVSVQALHRLQWDLMAELDDLRLLKRWFSILSNSCEVVIPMYDWWTALQLKGARRGHDIRNYFKSLVGYFYVSAQSFAKQCGNSFTTLIEEVPTYRRVQ